MIEPPIMFMFQPSILKCRHAVESLIASYITALDTLVEKERITRKKANF